MVEDSDFSIPDELRGHALSLGLINRLSKSLEIIFNLPRKSIDDFGSKGAYT